MGNEKLKSLRVILIISLCFNMLFLSGYAAIFLTVRKLSTPKGRIAYVARHLKLTNTQKMDLWELSRTIREYRRENRIKEINELCAELSKNNPDYERINELMGRVVEARSKFLGFVSEQVQPFLKALTFEQRQIIVKKIEKLQKVIMAE